MDDTNILPTIFKELVERADKIEQITPQTMALYYATINEDESFIPEMVSIIGPDNFELLVRYFGGQSFRIPRAEDILHTAKGALNEQ